VGEALSRQRLERVALSLILSAAAAPILARPTEPVRSAAPDRSAAETAAGGAAAGDGRGDLVEYVEVNVSELPTSNTIATKLPTPQQQTPANVGTVGGALLREQDAEVLGDALRNISGVNVQAGPAVHDFFAIRGFDSLSSALVMVDGVSEPEATFYELYNFEGVEVLKGPGGFLYGSSAAGNNALGGAVNMVRKQPLPGDFAVVGASFGSHASREGTLDWNLASAGGERAFRLNAIFDEADGYRDDHDREFFGVNPGLSWKAGERTSFNLNVEVAGAESRPDSGLPLHDADGPGPGSAGIPAVSRRTSYQSPVEFSEQDIVRLQFNWESQLSDKLRLRNKLYHRSLDWNSAGSLLHGTVDLGSGPLVLRTLTTLDDEQRFSGNQFEAVLGIETGSVRHEILAGVELARYADEFTLAYLPPQLSFTPFGPFPCDPSAPGMPCIELFDPHETFTAIPADAAFVPLGAGDSTSDVVAPYVVDQMRISPRIHLSLGARYDSIDFEDDVSGRSRHDAELSPMLGLVVAPDEALSLYGNVGRSHAPAISSRGVTGELEPERGTQAEIGVKQRFLDGRLQTTVAVYHIERENIPIPDETGFLLQNGDQESRGVEIEAAAEPLPRLRTLFSYAFNDSELTRFRDTDPATGMTRDLSGNTPPYAPEHVANLWVSKSFASGFGVAGGARYWSGQFFSADNAFEVDGALVLDAAAFYDLEAWRFKLNVKNLTDEEYESGSFASTSVVPANPLSVYGSLDYRF